MTNDPFDFAEAEHFDKLSVPPVEAQGFAMTND
jgi:hypothetical protein